MDRFDAMEAFVRVVDAGSFTKAAETLRRKSNDLASSLAAMQRLSRQPTAALVLRPASVEDTARTAIVLDRVRGQGVGKALVGQLIDDATARGSSGGRPRMNSTAPATEG